MLPSISSMYAYLYQNWSTRGMSVTARSHTLRAADRPRARSGQLVQLQLRRGVAAAPDEMNRPFISISAYLSHSVWLR